MSTEPSTNAKKPPSRPETPPKGRRDATSPPYNPHPRQGRQGLPWLIRLRWGAALLIALGFAWVYLGMGMSVPIRPLMGLLGLQLLSNVGLSLLRLEGLGRGSQLFGGVLILDTLILTGFLTLTGGASNPFTVLYLVQVVLAAVVLGTRWTWAMAIISSLSFALLFVLDGGMADHASMGHTSMDHTSMDHAAMNHGAADAPHEGYISHLQGMWGAFTLTAALVAFFLVRITQALREAERAAGHFQAIALKSAHLADLTTLAAGAAHELATPLGSILLASTELERDPIIAGQAHLASDIKLIKEEVLRCRSILDEMHPLQIGDAEPKEALSYDELWRALSSLFEGRGSHPLRLKGALPEGQLYIERSSLIRVLTSLIQNAMDASPPGEQVFVDIKEEGEQIKIQIIDQGSGMSPALLARAAAPFVTTKDGKGMGLGLFLAQTFAAQAGGSLDLKSAPNEGSVITLSLPLNKGAS